MTLTRQKEVSARQNVSRRTTVAASVVILLWASAFVAVKVALAELPPGPLALARYAVASAVFLVLLVVRKLAVPRPRDLLRLALAGAVGIALYNVILNTGQLTVSAGVASLLVNTAPIWTSLLSIFLLKERITRIGWIGTIISFLGVALIGLHKGGWTGFESGVLLILTAAVCQALYFVISKPLLERYHPLDLTTYVVWSGCLCLAPFSTGLPASLRESSPSTLGAVVFLGVGPAALAYVAWSYVLAEVPAGRASNLLFLVPVAALALGWLILNEVPSLWALVGGAIAIFGVLVSKGLVSRHPTTDTMP